ncbi:histidine triad nucleotide-binding protein [Oryzobacter terrae]|uniref:histidine triad nucleotide-binding protein n=1 Tax=Oryzobacter terrae TaxID=1620385 RepID=UPI00366B2FE3
MSEPSSSDCLFCRIVAGSIPAEVVAESEHSLAFRDVNPQAPTHVLVVPRRHVADAGELAAASADDLADVVRLASRVAELEGLARGHRLVLNTGSGAGQTVFHAHVHVLGGRDLGWPPG